MPCERWCQVGVHYCNMPCVYNDNDEQECTGSPVSHIDRRCLTYRHRPQGENYRGMMRTFETNCDKDSAGGGYKTRRITGVLK